MCLVELDEHGNQISGFGINVGDLDRSAEFYTRGLGLQEKGKYDLGAHARGAGRHRERRRVHPPDQVHRSVPRAPDIGTGFEKIVLVCDDVAGAYERALAEGGTSQLEPRTIEQMGLTVAMVRDPDGYLIELVKQG